jgi:hypothetical protein
MKSKQYLLIVSLIACLTLAGASVHAQETKPGRKGEPDERWDVKKEYDVHGNLIYYDSSYSRTWKHHDFPGFEDWQPFENMDSLFGHFFHCPKDPFKHHPFAFGPFSEFMDSLDFDFHLDSSFFQSPHGFMPFKGFPDSAWMDSFFNDSLYRLPPKWQQMLRKQKKSSRRIEI